MADDSIGATTAPPSKATDAVLLVSDPVPEGVQQVQGVDFNAHHAADITVAELVDGMANMGFQASAVADAVQIINQMVRPPWIPSVQVQL
jgi:deoxyhypusine synthase